MISKKRLVVIFVLSLLISSAQITSAEKARCQSRGEEQVQVGAMIQNQEQNQTMEQMGENNMYQWRYKYRTKIQEGIENETVVKECNISKKAGKLYIYSCEYQKGMAVEVKEQNQHKLQIKVSAEFKEGKVIVLNIESSAFQVKNSQQLKIKFDGEETKEANIDEVVKGNGTQAKYAAAIGDDGGQYLVYIPHFSEHMITFEQIEPAAATQTTNFIFGAVGIALLTILILVIVIIKTGKFKKV